MGYAGRPFGSYQEMQSALLYSPSQRGFQQISEISFWIKKDHQSNVNTDLIFDIF